MVYNLGATLKPAKGVVAKVNIFRNDIDNLIQTVPVQEKKTDRVFSLIRTLTKSLPRNRNRVVCKFPEQFYACGRLSIP